MSDNAWRLFDGSMKRLITEIPCLQGERVTLGRLGLSDADGLRELTASAEVYRYLPTFLFEKQFDDAQEVIRRLYDECLERSLILGVFMGGDFCGLAEIYGYRAPFRKVSVGYRLLPQYWGRGIATETLGLMLDYLMNQTKVDIITASTMVENQASANVLRKNGFQHVAHGVWENWGYPFPTVTDKWLKTRLGYRRQYRFQT